MLTLDPYEKTWMNFDRKKKKKIFTWEQTFENVVCNMVAMLFKPHYVQQSIGRFYQT